MSEEGSILIPVEQKQVLFYEDEITAVRVTEAGRPVVYVPLRPICDYLGVSWSGQRDRTVRDPVLKTEVRGVRVTRTPGAGGGTQEMTCLPLDYLSGWLFGINATRVKPEVRDRLIRYQRECYRVLAEAFQEGRLTGDETFEDLLQTADPGVVQAYQMALAVVKLARNQIMLESRLEGHEQRLERLEATLGSPGRQVTEEQASQISQAVKAVAMALSQKSGRNEYGGVYGELYRRFAITSYKLLPAGRFHEAMKFLTDWHQNLTGEVPF